MHQPDHPPPPPAPGTDQAHQPADTITGTGPATTGNGDGGESRRGPGRPRKWVDNAERMRAYRRRQRLDAAKVATGDGRRELVEQLTAVTAERDQLAADVVVLRRRVDELETQLRARQPPRSPTPPPPRSASQPPPRSASQPASSSAGVDGPRLSRAQRRQLEREQRRRR